MIPGIPLLGQLSWRLFLVMIMDLKQRQVQEKKKKGGDINFIPSCFPLKDVYFLSHYPVTAGRLTGTVNPKSLPAHQLATICSFVSLRLKFNLLGRLTSGSGRSCDLKDIGYHQGGTLYAACASRQSSSSFGETWWCISCIRIKHIYAQWRRDVEARMMTTEERTWKASEELSALHLFMCKTWVSAVIGNEFCLCRQSNGAEQSEETEGWKQEK